MKQTFSTILLVLLSITAGSAYSIESKSISETIFYVSPDGSDSNSGAEESPLATLVGARDAIRKFKSSGEVTAPIVVSIKGGTYEMKESLVLLPEDGGTAKFPITYRAEEGSRPIFSGGKKITGFTSNESGVWEAKIQTRI